MYFAYPGTRTSVDCGSSGQSLELGTKTVLYKSSLKFLDDVGFVSSSLRDTIDNYCLMIAEEDGEVDDDFPALDNKEAISKFGFSTLALVEKEPVLPDDDSKLSGKDETIIVNM